ncbi:MAG: hypothetical protein NTW62_01495 [Candidatus Nomurabacteria bacterium]|nr:hypothetical protein [Candidatus Nomurabacteria bacterium]
MTRYTVEQSKRIELSWLKSKNFLEGYRSGNIKWSMNENPTGNINIVVDTFSEDPNIKLTYKIRKQREENWTDINFSLKMESLPCRFGGKKWFFICGLFKNNKYCGQRVRILYEAGNYFGCRKCANLSYESCNISGLAKQFGRIVSFPEIEKIREKAKRTHYNGKLTKKYLRYLRIEEKSEDSFVGISMLLTEKVKRIKNNFRK